MQNLLATIFRLDGNNNTAELLDWLQNNTCDPNELLTALYHLLTAQRWQSALVVALVLEAMGFQHHIIALALSLAGLLHENTAAKQRGLESLPSHAAELTDQQQENTYLQILMPAMSQLLAKFFKENNRAGILSLLDILKAGVPNLRTLFDASPCPSLCLETMRRAAECQPMPLMAAPSRQSRSVLLVLRSRTLPGATMSRSLHVATALQHYGWQVSRYPIHQESLPEDCLPLCRAIVATALQQQADIVLLDDAFLNPLNRLGQEMLAQLRRQNPALQVVGCALQASPEQPHPLLEAAPFLNALWMLDGVPATPHHPALVGKLLCVPMPAAQEAAREPWAGQLVYHGNLGHTDTLYHLFWLCAAESLGLPIHAPWPQGGATATGYPAVRGTLLLTLQANQSRTLPPHSFATLLRGELLVQERSPEMQRYFVPGTHYLEFSTLAELAAISRFLAENPAAAEEIRQAGHAFAQAHYSQEAVIAALDALLYGAADAPAVSPPWPPTAALYTFHNGGVRPLLAPSESPTPPPEEGQAPHISVVVPVYKTAQYLEHCLDSILTQTGLDFEIICVDDCSPDGSWAILECYAALDARLRAIRHSRNHGQGAARNTAIQAARGLYIACVDSDDYIQPKMLEQLYQAASQADADVVAFGYHMVDDEGEILATYIPSFTTLNPAFWNKIWRRSLFVDHRIRFPVQVYFEDLPTTFELRCHAQCVILQERAHYMYRVRPGSVTTTGSAKHLLDSLKVLSQLRQYMLRAGITEAMQNSFNNMANGHWLHHAQSVAQGEMSERDRLQYIKHIVMLKRAFTAWDAELDGYDQEMLLELL